MFANPRECSNLTNALFSEAICLAHSKCEGTALIGLCGSQGSGKSTLAAQLGVSLEKRGLTHVVCSLDDFYLTKAERTNLADKIHPLLRTRGVPGTHDVGLMMDVISSLMHAKSGQTTSIPVFDKASDDRKLPSHWMKYQGRPDIIILEGWCIGASPQSFELLREPVNDLEATEDPKRIWREYVNDCLKGPYADVFRQIDLRLMLRAPSFERVHVWRSEQEAGLDRNAIHAKPPMTSQQLTRFIAHYERITRWLLRTEPADLIAELNENRVASRWRGVSN